MTITDTHRAAVWQAASLLLDYPDENLLAHQNLLRRTASALPDALGAGLTRVLDHLDAKPMVDLTADYVATFDHRKQCSPYLTYFTHGDTRKRGMALLRIKHIYRDAGMRLHDSELPDHLSVVLEFAATVDPAAGRRLLTEYRAGLELLRLALGELGSPWAGVLDAVSATLPALAGSDRDAVARLAAQGPPDEEVGLEPFFPVESLLDRRGATR